MTLNILPRSAWTPTVPGGATRASRDVVTHFLLHWPAMGTRRVRGREAVAAQLRAWRNQHLANGWGDIGYNWAVDQDGNVWELRGERVGAQAANFNTPSLGLVFIVGEDEVPTPEAVSAAHALRADLRTRFRNMNTMAGHREAPGQSTSCPGPHVLSSMRAPSTPTPAPAPSAPTVTQLAQEVIAGQWGNNPQRAQRLTAAGHNATAVQAEVNRILSGGSVSAPAPARPTVAQLATEVIAGKWGNGAERTRRLTAAGHNAAAVQAEVNRRLLGR